MNNEQIWIHVPAICGGQIVEYKKTYDIFMVKVTSSPRGAFNGAISCSLIYPPGTKDNYKVGDRVKILTSFHFDPNNMNEPWGDRVSSMKSYILGLYGESKIINIEASESVYKTEKSMSYMDKSGHTGMTIDEKGGVNIITKGGTNTSLSSFGNGVFENMKQERYQNFHRIITLKPFANREYFGYYKGKDDDDKVSRSSPDQRYICYKRFVSQTASHDGWVSTCEGTWNPWIGANNKVNKIKKINDILYTKIINSGLKIPSNRITIEGGEEGAEFYNFRIDKMILNEQSIPVVGGATPAISGNALKLSMSEDGEVDFKAACSKLPITNFSGVNVKIDKNGNLTIYFKGKLKLAHSQLDEETCSLEFNGKGGINIKSLGGVTINGKPLVSSPLVDFLVANLMSLFTIPTIPTPAGPAVSPYINPKAAADLTVLSKLDPKSPIPGFVTTGLPIVPPITGKQPFSDSHPTTA